MQEELDERDNNAVHYCETNYVCNMYKNETKTGAQKRVIAPPLQTNDERPGTFCRQSRHTIYANQVIVIRMNHLYFKVWRIEFLISVKGPLQNLF